MKPYKDDKRTKGEQVEAMFDGIAPVYDRLNDIMSLGIARRWRKRVVKEVKIMRKILSTALMLVAGAAAAQTIPSKVTEATVFLRGAELTHTATAVLKKGANEITVEGFGTGVDTGSLRVNMGGRAVVSAFEFSFDHLADKTPTGRLKMLQDSMKIYDEAMRRLNVEINVNGELQSYLDEGIDEALSSTPDTRLTFDELQKTLEYYKSKSEEIQNARRTLQDRRNEVYAALTRVQNQYHEEAGLSGGPRGVLKLTVSAPAAGTYPMTITYYTPGAGWRPFYDINAASIERPVVIAARSHVLQTTGQEWQNVRLTLSSATPSNGKVAPVPQTWFLRGAMPEDEVANTRQRKMSASAMEVNAVMVSEDAVFYEPQQVTGAYTKVSMADYIETSDNALNVLWAIDLPYTIPGNGKEQTIDLVTKETLAEFKYLSMPRLDNATYLVAEIADRQELSLMRAPANVTYDGTYIGETTIDPSSAQEKLTVTLGADKRVPVTREVVREYSSTRTSGGQTEQTTVWRITVRNNQTRPVDIVLRDQYPVSTDRAITVTLDTRRTTPWSARDEQTGLLTWERRLAAGEVLIVETAYTVRHPREMTVE